MAERSLSPPSAVRELAMPIDAESRNELSVGPPCSRACRREKTVRYYDYGSAAPRGRLKPEFARGLGERRGVDPYCAQEHSAVTARTAALRKRKGARLRGASRSLFPEITPNQLLYDLVALHLSNDVARISVARNVCRIAREQVTHELVHGVVPLLFKRNCHFGESLFHRRYFLLHLNSWVLNGSSHFPVIKTPPRAHFSLSISGRPMRPHYINTCFESLFQPGNIPAAGLRHVRPTASAAAGNLCRFTDYGTCIEALLHKILADGSNKKNLLSPISIQAALCLIRASRERRLPGCAALPGLPDLQTQPPQALGRP